MLEWRILIAAMELRSPEESAHIIKSAIQNAAKPTRLLFSLPMACQPQDAQDELTALIDTLPRGDVRFFGEGEGVKAAVTPRSGATHVLLLRGAYQFDKGWDRVLIDRWERCQSPSAVLTGAISPLSDPYKPQCFLPALTGEFFGEGAILGLGVALVCSQAPVRTLLVNPNLIFARHAFFLNIPQETSTLSFACFAANVRVFALDRAVLYPLQAPRERRICRPPVRYLPGGSLDRFEKRVGFDPDTRTVGQKARWGYFDTDTAYPQALSPAATLKETALRPLKQHKMRRLLMVSALVELPEPERQPLHYLTRFDYLRAIAGLSLIIYASGRFERSLRARFPSTLSYPERGLLPYDTRLAPMPPRAYFQRGKLPLLKRTLDVYSGYTHAVWVNADLLGHPICPQAGCDLRHLMDDKVHMATVDGCPDCSMLVVPAGHIKLLAREAVAINQLDVEMKLELSELSLINRLIAKFPDLFTLHPMSKRGMLLLTGFDSETLTRKEQALLAMTGEMTKIEGER